jgi:hypothetical protein
LDDKGRSGAVIAVIYGVRASKSSLGARHRKPRKPRQHLFRASRAL